MFRMSIPTVIPSGIPAPESGWESEMGSQSGESRNSNSRHSGVKRFRGSFAVAANSIHQAVDARGAMDGRSARFAAVHIGTHLRGRMTPESLLRGLFRHVEHSGDSLPRRSIGSGARHRVRQCGVCGFADHAQELDEIQGRFVEGLADEGSVICDHIALVEECVVGIGHTSSVVDARSLSRVVDEKQQKGASQ